MKEKRLNDIPDLAERQRVIKRINRGHQVELGDVVVDLQSRQVQSMGCPKSVTDKFFNNNPKLTYWVEHSINGFYVAEKSDGETYFDRMYKILIDLDEEEYLFWKLANE